MRFGNIVNSRVGTILEFDFEKFRTTFGTQNSNGKQIHRIRNGSHGTQKSHGTIFGQVPSLPRICVPVPLPTPECNLVEVLWAIFLEIPIFFLKAEGVICRNLCNFTFLKTKVTKASFSLFSALVTMWSRAPMKFLQSFKR